MKNEYPPLGEFEQLILLAVLRLGDAAYGVSIREEIANHAHRAVAPGALYTTLDRLEAKELIGSTIGDPTPVRGGRAKRFYQVTTEGRNRLVEAQSAYQRMLQGLELIGGHNG